MTDTNTKVNSDNLFSLFEELNEVNQRYIMEHTLVLSAEEGNDKVFMRLLEKLGDTILTSQTAFALVAASRNGHDKIVQKLFETKHKNSCHFREAIPAAIQLAFKNGHLNVLKILLDKMSDQFSLNDKVGVFYLAAKQGDNDLVVTLLNEIGKNLCFFPDLDGALIRAHSNGHTAVIDTIINHPAVKGRDEMVEKSVASFTPSYEAVSVKKEVVEPKNEVTLINYKL